MKDWLLLIVSIVTGGAAGAVASVATAVRIARGSELGRVQEQARQAMLTAVREWRAQVLVDRVDASWNVAMGSEYLRPTHGLAFAQTIEANLVHCPEPLSETLRGHLVRLVGPTNAHIARNLYPVAIENRDEQWLVLATLQTAEGLTPEKRGDGGLLSRARAATFVGDFVKEIVAELEQMDAELVRAGSRWRFGRSRHRASAV